MSYGVHIHAGLFSLSVLSVGLQVSGQEVHTYA